MSDTQQTQTPSIRGFGRSVVLLVVLISAGFLAIVVWGAYSAVERLSEEAIDRAASQTASELTRFFAPVEVALQTSLDWAANGDLDPKDVAGMNRRFVPLLRNLPQVGSMLVATPEGVEYMLLREGTEWVNRSTDVPARPGETHWYRWTSVDSPPKRWTKQLDYDPRKRPWFEEAQRQEPGESAWTEPYTFFTTKDPGITVSSRVKTPGGELVIAFDVLLLDVSRFTTGFEVSRRGRALVLTDDARVLGLPRDPGFETVDEIKKFVLKPPSDIGVPAAAHALDAWEANSRQEQVGFSLGNESWLAAFREFPLGHRKLWVGAVVPQSDFRGDVRTQRISLIVLILFGIVAATGMAVFYTRRYQQELREAVDKARDQLGQYQLQSKIGQGGMGAVYRGSHLLMRREVAVKLVRADRISGEALARFEREVQMTSRLSHPNTIQIYDYGRTPDGTFYYVMELLNGVSLARFIEAARTVNEARTIYLVRQICESLREAHAIGLVHRDIKPGNIHICERGGRYDFVKVLDFGLVKDVAAQEEQTNLTGESSFGTPGFVAPEAIREAGKATALSDIYAVGTVAYALLTGTLLFAENNKVKLLLRQMNEDPKPPSERIGRPVAADLEAVVMAMLRRDPAERPQSMDEVLELLAGCKDAHGWTAADARVWWGRFPELFAGRAEFTLDEDDRPTVAIAMKGRDPHAE